jgi:hypothetical protein
MIQKPATTIFLALMAALQSYNLKAQTNPEFTPYFKPNVLIYTDIKSTVTRDAATKSFDITRAYLGFEYFFSRKISSRINLDVADPGVGGLQMTAYIKLAYLQYKTEKFTTRFGMIATEQYSIQEKLWGYRYIYKSYQDAYNMGPSADLGAAAEYTPVQFLTVDISVLNGEGYKKIQSDSTFKTSFGLTIRPFKGFILRGYYDMMDHKYNQETLALFAGYTYKNFRAGIEYNYQHDNRMLNEQNFSGVSFYSAIVIAKKFSIFGRYDNLKSTVISGETLPWNLSRDGQLFMAGFDYTPTTGVRIAPNFQGWSPRDTSMPFASTFALNFEIKF